MTCIDISHASAVTVIGSIFLCDCTVLTKVDLSGLHGVTSIGSGFLFKCTSLSTVDLKGLAAVTAIGVPLRVHIIDDQFSPCNNNMCD